MKKIMTDQHSRCCARENRTGRASKPADVVRVGCQRESVKDNRCPSFTQVYMTG